MEDRTFIPVGEPVDTIEYVKSPDDCDLTADPPLGEQGPFVLEVGAEEFDRLIPQVPVFVPVPKRTVTAEDKRAKQKLVAKRRAKSKAGAKSRSRNRN